MATCKKRITISSHYKKFLVGVMMKTPSTLKTLLVVFGCIGLLVISILSYGVYWAFFDMNRLPSGEFLTEKTSPSGQYTVKTYKVYGGATVPNTIRGELIINERQKQPKNIYWNKEEAVEIEWLNQNTIIINGHTLQMPTDTFDYRND